MKQEDKELLLKNLCARLPYRVKYDIVLDDGKYGSGGVLYDDLKNGYLDIEDLHIVRPYLRPLSSMTEEERRYCYEHAILFSCDINHNIYFDGFGNISADETIDGFDWLNSHHFDYRGLIEKGLALEAPEGMYNEKEK